MQVFIICVYRSNLALLIRLCVKVPCGRCEFMSSWGLTICSIRNYRSFMIILHYTTLCNPVSGTSTIHSNAMVLITGLLFKCSECRALAICLGVELSKSILRHWQQPNRSSKKKLTRLVDFIRF